MPIPPSWSKKKQREAIGQQHISNPDLDNLIKGAFDGFNKFIWNDDNQVCELVADKKYGLEPGIEVELFF
jgi:Holliday junction resolvase RusA-like endonuclease